MLIYNNLNFLKNVVIKNVAMIDNSIFIQYTPKSNFLLNDSFLDLEFAFDLNERQIPMPNFQSQDQDQAEQSLSFQPLLSDLNPNSIINRNQSNNDFTEISNQISQSLPESKNNKKNIAKSKITKNICFNICQKTIKVMKTRLYDSQLSSFAAEYDLNSQKVIQKVLKVKKDLTGPKALRMFVETDDKISKVFKKFMKWFLQEKYLRHAINEGTMQDIKGYLQFKNQVILNLLEN